MNVTGNKANIFWSGGWDSTFELCRLSLKPIQVQPVYIIFDRPYHTGQEYEIKAQDKILDLLRKRPTTKAEILPLIRVHRKSIKLSKEITDAYYRINKTFDKLGQQWYFLAGYANTHPNMRVMICDYAHSVGRTMKLIRKCNCKFDDERTLYISRNGSDADAYALFGKELFPMADFDQNYVVQWIKENQFEDIMKEIWTCWYPVNGEPCGFCHACCIKIKQHLDFLMSKEAIKRGFVCNYLNDKFEHEKDKLYHKDRLNRLFCIWLRRELNPEIVNFPLLYDDLSLTKKQAIGHRNKLRYYYSDEMGVKLEPYIPYFKQLLASDIEYRNMSDRLQLWGIY